MVVLTVLAVLAVVPVRRALRDRRIRRAGRSTDLATATLAGDLAGSVRTGATLTTGLAEATTVDRPLADQVAGLLERTRRGWTMDEAMDEWGRTSGRPSVLALVHACRFASEHGGDLAVALDGVSVAIGDRLEVTDETAALAAQVRTSTAVLASLPAIGAVLLALVDPAVAHTLLATPVGAVCVAVAVILDGVGLAVSRWLVSRSLR